MSVTVIIQNMNFQIEDPIKVSQTQPIASNGQPEELNSNVLLVKEDPQNINDLLLEEEISRSTTKGPSRLSKNMKYLIISIII